MAFRADKNESGQGTIHRRGGPEGSTWAWQGPLQNSPMEVFRELSTVQEAHGSRATQLGCCRGGKAGFHLAHSEPNPEGILHKYP